MSDRTPDPLSVPPGAVGPDGLDLAALLRGLGVDEAEIDAAEAVDRLELLAMASVAMPGGPRYDEAEVAELVGVPAEHSRQFWRALGFPEPDPGAKVFTDEDVEMIRDVLAVLDEDAISEDISIEITRVIGSSMARIALAQIDAVEAALRRQSEREADGSDDGGEVLRTASFLPLMPQVFAYVWRRHLAAGARARLALAEAEQDEDELVVGFADLVGYTALSQQLTDAELAAVVQRFEATAYDTVSALGGRVVKLIGDGVMFSADDVDDAVDIALELAERYRDDEELSDVRVGLAWGPVLRRDGDLYGPTVNLASRIVNVAYPGTVLVGERLCGVLEEDDAYELKKVRSHNLKDIGRTRLWRLRRAEPDEADERQQADDGDPVAAAAGDDADLDEEERAKRAAKAAKRAERDARRAERDAERERRRAEKEAEKEVEREAKRAAAEADDEAGDDEPDGSAVDDAPGAADRDDDGSEARRRAQAKREARRELMAQRRARRRGDD